MLGKCGGKPGSKDWKRHAQQLGGKDSSRMVRKGKEGQKHSRWEYSMDAAKRAHLAPKPYDKPPMRGAQSLLHRPVGR